MFQQLFILCLYWFINMESTAGSGQKHRSKHEALVHVHTRDETVHNKEDSSLLKSPHSNTRMVCVVKYELYVAADQRIRHHDCFSVRLKKKK